MRVDCFDFDLPDSLIAVHPVSPRDAARMLVVGDHLQDKIIRDLPRFLRPGDVMVFNDTRVIPARLFGRRGEARVEVLLHKPSPCLSRGLESDSAIRRDLWQCFARPAKRLKSGDRIAFAEDFHAEVIEKQPSGEVVLAFGDGLHEKLRRYGHMPLPPYITRQDEIADRERYQTVYAREEGSVAAPTAGLHFTESLLAAIDVAGVRRAHVTLHIGGGTFLPVKAEDTADHIMHSEYAVVTPGAADIINRAREAGGRVIAVGTTSLRTLESAADNAGRIHPFASETNIFITPGYRFKAADLLLTNFHLPRSTLFMLTAAFSGLERMQAAYRHAIAQRYRFYSYGDACLLEKA
ncbi:MAG: tRNA preQ1(34) S-adenosylmethionine ribosyltransferase-isomerase QueA [Pseudomonadota bacterium]|nr:tRNA preQ1(34) S-adenosylmethionine ribosyltransferase-isomerase QueA [Pseudomonadota bacterium]